MALNSTMILKDTQGKLLTTQIDASVPVGFNGGTPLVPDCRVTITSSGTGLWKLGGLSYDTAGRLAVTTTGPPVDWVAGIPLDFKGRMYVESAPIAFYNSDGIPITWAGAVAMGMSYAPGDLFAAGEEGVWFDPSDFSTMFQDTAGTIPVTHEGQAVGRILDKSGNGHYGVFLVNKPMLVKDEAGLYYLDIVPLTGMETDEIDLTGTDELTVWAGIRKLS